MRVIRLGAWRLVLALAILAGLIYAAAWGAGAVMRLLYPLPYTADIGPEAAANDLDPFLVAAVIRVESRFFPGAVSEPGARGLMQVLPETGAWVAGQVGISSFEPAMLFEPGTNIAIGTWYLAFLRDEFGGNVPAALAAYNAGHRPVREWLAADQWDGTADDLGGIPFPETRVFVERVLRDREIYNVLYPGAFAR